MEWHQGNDAGSQLSAIRKFLIHTTEGSSVEGAIAAYEANNSWPHETVDYRFGRVPRRVGHLVASQAARSLRNESGGVETNRDGVYQIEVVGFATNPAGINWERLAREVIGPVCRQLAIPIRSTVTWVAYPASYGQSAPQRLSGSTWDFYEGILGHQHCPENSHGDPGAIPIQAILAAAISQEDSLSAEEVADIKAHITAEADRVIHEIQDSRPYFAQDPERRDQLWVVFKQAGVRVKVPTDTEGPGLAWDLDRVFSDYENRWSNGYPKAWDRSGEHLAQYRIVEAALSGETPAGEPADG